jgi:hypothetical protein
MGKLYLIVEYFWRRLPPERQFPVRVYAGREQAERDAQAMTQQRAQLLAQAPLLREHMQAWSEANPRSSYVAEKAEVRRKALLLGAKSDMEVHILDYPAEPNTFEVVEIEFIDSASDRAS